MNLDLLEEFSDVFVASFGGNPGVSEDPSKTSEKAADWVFDCNQPTLASNTWEANND